MRYYFYQYGKYTKLPIPIFKQLSAAYIMNASYISPIFPPVYPIMTPAIEEIPSPSERLGNEASHDQFSSLTQRNLNTDNYQIPPLATSIFSSSSSSSSQNNQSQAKPKIDHSKTGMMSHMHSQIASDLTQNSLSPHLPFPRPRSSR